MAWAVSEREIYLLHTHRGHYEAERAESIHQEFAARRPLVLKRSEKPHLHYEILRESAE
jgi:hypothetical protein